MSAELNLDSVHTYMHDRVLMHAESGDYDRMLAACNHPLSFVVDNWEAFAELGVLESVLLRAWNRTTFTHGYQDWMRMLLMLSDREMLMEASEPLPPGDTFTVYRGVMRKTKVELWGKRLGGDKNCLSWTLDPGVARKFASPDGVGGTVYATEVRRDQILAYFGGEGNKHGYRPESEVLLMLDKRHPIRVHEKIRSKRRRTKAVELAAD